MSQSAYEHLSESLTQTSVISDSYKGFIMAWALKIAEEAYKNGQEDGPQVQQHAEPRTSVRRYHLSDTIRNVLNSLAGTDALIELAYTAENGNYSERQVRAVRIFDGPTGRSFISGREYVLAIDVQKDEPRHFLLDNIEWIEVQ